MKKVLLIVVILIIAAGAAFLFLSRNTNVLSNLGIGTSNKITLVKEAGTVSYKEKESDEYKELLDEDLEIKTGSFIKTDKESYARVFLPDNSLVSIDQSTEIQVNFDNNKTNIDQLIGKTWNRVQTLTNGGEFKVQTPNTIAAVRGTIFGVGVDDDEHSRVFSIEHKINVAKHGGDNNITEDEDIEDGQQAEINDDSGELDINLGELSDAILGSFWYERNKVIDEEWTKIKDLKGNLLDLLRENLQKRSDFEDLKLGLEPKAANNDEIREKLADVYAISTIDSNTCTRFSQDDIQRASDNVKRYKENIQDADDIIALLYTLGEVCRDGEINVEEADFLQLLVDGVNGN